MANTTRVPDGSTPRWETLKGPAVAAVGTDVGPKPKGNKPAKQFKSVSVKSVRGTKR
jgi:hypothetical protein